MRNTQFNILNASDAETQTGASQWVGQIVAASFVPTCGDDSADGTLKIQGSNDSPAGVTAPTQFTPTNWADIPNATSTIASGVGPAIVISTLCFAYIRAIYTSNSGGTTQISVQMNVLGC